MGGRTFFGRRCQARAGEEEPIALRGSPWVQSRALARRAHGGGGGGGQCQASCALALAWKPWGRGWSPGGRRRPGCGAWNPVEDPGCQPCAQPAARCRRSNLPTPEAGEGLPQSAVPCGSPDRSVGVGGLDRARGRVRLGKDPRPSRRDSAPRLGPTQGSHAWRLGWPRTFRISSGLGLPPLPPGTGSTGPAPSHPAFLLASALVRLEFCCGPG